MKKRIIIVLVLFCQVGFSQTISDKVIQDLTSGLEGVSANEKLIEIGKKFLGKPYVGGTLESPIEKLICRLDAFDCYTFVETVLALSLISEDHEPSLESFREEVQFLRYRNGEINGYASRIHYFFEWAKLAEENGVLKDLTPTLGSANPKNINFMSTHRQYYPAFKTNNQVLEQIKLMEKSVNKYPFYEIKKENLASVENQIKNGDILAFASSINGLDVNHEGLAYWKGDKLHFLHASSTEKKVVISSETLQSYLNKIQKDTGLMVLRINDDMDL